LISIEWTKTSTKRFLKMFHRRQKVRQKPEGVNDNRIYYFFGEQINKMGGGHDLIALHPLYKMATQ